MDWESAIFAPGWVWSMLSMVLVVGSLLGLYRQLRLQSSQTAIEQLERIEQEYASERMTRYQLAVLLALRDGADPADVPDSASGPIMNFWERVGSLARRGHLDVGLLWDGGSGFYCQSDWVMLAPSIQRTRNQRGNPKIAEHFEWLVQQMEAKARRVGIRLTDATSLAGGLDWAIANAEGMIQTEVALRSVVMVAPTEPPVPGSTSAEG